LPRSRSQLSFYISLRPCAEEEAEKLYNSLFEQCTLEHGKSVSKAERYEKGLTSQKVR
jgi:hypothetical protein